MNLDPRIAALLDRWEQLKEEGQELPAEELCADCPELAPEVERWLGLLQNRPEPSVVQEASTRSPGSHTEPFDPRATVDEETLVAGPTKLEEETISASANYRGLRYLARGGLGKVFSAGDGELGRDVALKFMHEKWLGHEPSRVRFRVEAELTSQLDHPGVVPVFSYGDDAHRGPFYAMQLVRGRTLDEAIEEFHAMRTIARDRVEFQHLLQAFIRVCETVSYAHSRGVVHCDIKPKNVMIGRYGETYVMDWGMAVATGKDSLARPNEDETIRPTSDTASSSSGGGTPAFMSPEQRLGTVNRRSDVYSLGATLYKILTNQTTLSSTHGVEAHPAVQPSEFTSPRALNRDVPPALDAICTKAMAIRPENRYRTAEELARDVECWTADEPVEAFTESLFERLVRWSRRHQARAAKFGVLAAVSMGVLVFIAMLLAAMAQREHVAHTNAEAANRRLLLMSADFTADLVGKEIENRWRILQLEASKPSLLKEIHSFDTKMSPPPKIVLNSDQQRPLQKRLNNVWLKWRSATGAASMLVLNTQGIVLARVPKEKNTHNVVGGNFGFRDYFHGRGEDLDPAVAAADAALTPISNPYVSVPFISRDNGKLRVQFTVPIKDEMDNTIGVLGMAVDSGGFDSLNKSDQRRRIVLVDMRPSIIDGEQRQNLVLHHTNMDRQLKKSLDVPTFERLCELVKQYEYKPDGPQESAAHESSDDFLDPITKTHCQAAFKPVLVRRSSNHDPEPVKWIVIAEQEW